MGSNVSQHSVIWDSPDTELRGRPLGTSAMPCRRGMGRLEAVARAPRAGDQATPLAVRQDTARLSEGPPSLHGAPQTLCAKQPCLLTWRF